jgi:hypothetical protein
MPRKTDIVVTTIFEPAWLRGYLDNLRAHGRDADVTLRIVCDRKTPATVYAAAAEATAAGFHIDCPTLDEQQAYLKSLGFADDFVPWNTDNRRNIGFLRAWQSGADVLVSIDDDNYCLADSDFVGEHHVVGKRAAETQALGAAGAPWFNICDMLDLNVRAPVFARGYPYAARKPASQARPAALDATLGARTIAINAGLWLDDPDVDALTRLAMGPRASAAKPGAVILAPETWSPINTQNTALMREAIPAYYYVRMGFPLQGLRIDRFGDILSGYFVQKCAKHLGHVVRLGSPVAEHRRTPHNLFKDLYHELAGVVLVEELLPWLQELQLSGGNYADAYASLADAIEARAPSFKGFVWDEGGREFLVDTARAMRSWLRVIGAPA